MALRTTPHLALDGQPDPVMPQRARRAAAVQVCCREPAQNTHSVLMPNVSSKGKQMFTQLDISSSDDHYAAFRPPQARVPVQQQPAWLSCTARHTDGSPVRINDRAAWRRPPHATSLDVSMCTPQPVCSSLPLPYTACPRHTHGPKHTHKPGKATCSALLGHPR